jgi:hypothetical protein
MGLQPWQGGRAAAYLGVPAQAVEEDLSRRERDRIRPGVAGQSGFKLLYGTSS